MIGFVRRGDNPTGHELIIEQRDELAQVWDRVTSRSLRAAVDQRAAGTASFSLSLMPPQIGVLVAGLESVFPTILHTRTRF